MTVEQAIQELVNLARAGKAQYELTAYGVGIDKIEVIEPFNEVNLTSNEPT